MTVTIDVSDPDALVDEVVSIVVRGLSRNQAITVHAHLTEKKLKFGSSACFYADQNGVVDLTKQSSVSGTYTGVSAMGLFWSMKSAPGERFGTRLMKADSTTPLVVSIDVYEGHVTFEDLYENSLPSLASSEIRRWYMAKGVRRIKVNSGRIRGALFLPPGPGPFMGVIDMFGIAGSLIDFRAALLASRGFAALALPYFVYEDLPKLLKNVELEYFLEAIDWLSDRPEVISNNIGIMGVSKGGEIALHAAYYSPKVKAGISINGAAFFTGEPMLFQGKVMGTSQVNTLIDKCVPTDEGTIYRHALVCNKEDYLPIWQKDKQIMLIASGDDQALDPAHLEELYRCYPAEKRHNCRLLYYPEAGHLLEPPYAPLCRSTYRVVKGYEGFEDMEDTVLWGGKTEEHAAAQEDSWKKILQHFRTHLSEKSSTCSKL